MHTEWAAIVFGLAAALTWGAGDFSGGLASKRTSVLVVVMVSQFVGALCLLGAALLGAAALPSGTDVVMGTAAGIFGVIGLLAFYQGLATSQMGGVASVAAATSALIPVGVGAWLEGVPAAHQLAGFELPIIVLAGLCDSAGNAFYALAASAGHLDIAALLPSLYPAATVAWPG